MNATDNSMNSSNEHLADHNLSLDPSKRQVYLEMLHKKDMKLSKYLELDFDNMLIDKKVRNRAIGERIEAIKQSHI